MEERIRAPQTDGLRRVFPTLLKIAVIAGTLDITENIVFNLFRGITPYMIFQYIASGLIGRASFSLGWSTVALGVAIHYSIAFAWTAVFYALSRKIALLLRRPVFSGLLYGAAVYVAMNFAVLPLTRVPRVAGTVTLASRISGILALLFCIGLTIALLIRRWLPAPTLN